MDVLGIPFAFPDVSKVKVLFQTPRAYQDFFGQYLDDLGVQNNSRVKSYKARQRLLEYLGISAFVEVTQIHGCRLIFNPKETFTRHTSAVDEGLLEEADGVCTNQKGIALLIKTADCQPVFLVDKQGACIAALHIGWRGNQKCFPTIAVKSFCSRYKIAAKDVLAVRGPSLCREHAQFRNFNEEWGNTFEKWFCKQDQTMDLWRLTVDQLVDGGILKEHIFSIDLCTYERPELFFSYRKDPLCGRQGSLIWIEP